MPQHSHAAALLILNGKGAGNEELRQAVTRLREEQITLYVRVTWEHGKRWPASQATCFLASSC